MNLESKIDKAHLVYLRIRTRYLQRQQQPKKVAAELRTQPMRSWAAMEQRSRAVAAKTTCSSQTLQDHFGTVVGRTFW